MPRLRRLLLCTLLVAGCASRPAGSPAPEVAAVPPTLTVVVEGWYEEMLALNPLTGWLRHHWR